MVFKSKVFMMYLFIANILNFTLNLSFVMSQGLSRYDEKGKIPIITYFCRSSHKLFETHIYNEEQNVLSSISVDI